MRSRFFVLQKTKRHGAPIFSRKPKAFEIKAQLSILKTSGLARLRAVLWSALTATGSHSLPTLQVPSNRNKTKDTECPYGHSVSLELMSGLEPPTYALPRRCATNCATSAYFLYFTRTILPQTQAVVKYFL